MSSFPYILSGKVYDTNGTTVLANIKVTARNENTNKTITTNSDASGDYSLDCANFSTGYNNGDIVTLFIVYRNLEDYEEHVIVMGGGGATINLTLVAVPASDNLRYFTVQDFFDFNSLTPGAENTPNTNDVVKIGVQVEDEIDRSCRTRFSDGQIEIEVDDCDATTGWSGSTDAVAIAVSTDDADYRTKTGALDLGKSGVTQAFFHYEKSTLTARSFDNRYVCFWVYLSSLSTLRAVDNGSAIQVRYGSSSSAYYEYLLYYNELIAGWNLIFFKEGQREVTTVGVPDIENMTYFRIRFDNTAASDTVTAGNFIIDNIFLVHEDHFVDEYLDTKSEYQRDYFATHVPIDRTVRLLVNRADESFDPAWDELLESEDEIRVDKNTGRVRIVDVITPLAEGQRVFPAQGANQVRFTYIQGRTFVPKEIRKLAILMTSRDLMHSAVSRALLRGQDSFKSEHFTVLDSQIDRILNRYRNLDILST